MRRRRAHRCLLRAEVALEAGFLDDASDALEEARRLNAPPEEIARIERLISARIAAPAEPSKRRLSWRSIAAAAALVGAATALISRPALRMTAPPGQVATARPAEPDREAPAVTVQNVLTTPAAVVVADTSGAEASAAVPAKRSQPQSNVERPQVSVEERERGGPLPVSARREDAPAPSLMARLSPPAVASAPPAIAAPLPLPAPPPVAAAPAAADEPAGVRPDVSPVPALSAPPVRDESAAVRAVLSRYETAYSQLDSAQARAVWPAVDDRALSRAFSGLASQRVSLGRCDVSVNGPSARATCAGSATWTPKVGGGGPRTQTRRWTFDLAKSGETWKIERAIVR